MHAYCLQYCLNMDNSSAHTPVSEDMNVESSEMHGTLNPNANSSSANVPNIGINLAKGCDNGGNSSKDTHATTGANKDKHELPPKGNHIPYVNLFKSNRMARTELKLQKMDLGPGMVKFGLDHIDSVEKTYGICLLGCVISGKPPTAALMDIVRRWGTNIQFQTHESGWIIFTFPSVEVRDSILAGGTYMVFGYHLFLKEMPRCFRFREEDMNSLPSWIQIHGLPPDCWNFYVLSMITSRIGIPIHMDMLTHDRRRVKFARVLVEMDITKPQLNEMVIELTVGDVTVTFEYEQHFKICEFCHKPGHAKDSCFALNQKAGDSKAATMGVPHRGRSRSAGWRNKARGKSTGHKSIQCDPSILQSGSKDKEPTVNDFELVDAPFNESSPPLVNKVPDDIENAQGIDKGKKVYESEFPVLGNSSSKSVEPEGKPTDGDNKNKKKKKKKKKVATEKSGNDEKMRDFFEDMDDGSLCNTEFVQGNGKNKQESFFGNEDKGRHPKSASGLQ